MIGIQGETALDEVTKSPADAELSTTSTNSVQNKVVTGEINKLNNDLSNKANAVDVMPNSITGYGNNSVNFTTAFRSAFNDISEGRSKLVYLTSYDKANCTGLFIKISSVWGILISATQDGKMFARYTVDGGYTVNTISTFA